MIFDRKAGHRHRWMLLGNALLFCFGMASPEGPLRAQTLEIGGGGGYGASLGENRNSTGAGAAGFYVGYSRNSVHKFQFDFLFANPRNRNFDLRFLTGSYRLENTSGSMRPFFQAGIGAEVRKLEIPVAGIDRTDTDFAFLFSGGATLDVAAPLFIRPELRTYVTMDSNVLVMPMITIGWRF
jgi:hypothetical protein